MKLDINNKKDSEVIAKYLAGEMSDDELSQFQKGIESFPDNKKLISEMEKHWKDMGQYKSKREVDADKGWEALLGRLDADELMPNNRVVEHRIIPLWAKYAASIAVILVIASISLFTVLDNKTNLISLNTGSDPNTLVQTLADGSIVYLANNSQFTYPEKFSKNERKVNLAGEAFFDITPNPQKPFRIETDKVIIEVLGTAFNVKAENSEAFELAVERGKVRVTLKSDPTQSQIVLPGEKIEASNNHLIKTRNNDANYFAWKTKQMKFKDELLGNVISVINRNYKSKIIIDKKLASKKFTTTFINQTVSGMTDLICSYYNLSKEIQPDSTIIIKPIEK